MTNKEALRLLYNITDVVYSGINYKIAGHQLYRDKNGEVKTMDLLCGYGNTARYFDDVDRVIIGAKEMIDNPDDPVDERNFMNVFMSIFHEYAHVDQCQNLLHDDSKEATHICANMLAHSFSYLNYSMNYNEQPYEIAAQYCAIRDGYNYLLKIVDKEKANDLVCNYVNDRINDGVEFIEFKRKDDKDIKYDDVYDILKSFDNVFKEKRNKHREMDVDILMDDPSPAISNRGVEFRKMALNSIASIEDGYEQDITMAVLYTNYAVNACDDEIVNKEIEQHINSLEAFKAMPKSGVLNRLRIWLDKHSDISLKHLESHDFDFIDVSETDNSESFNY